MSDLFNLLGQVSAALYGHDDPTMYCIHCDDETIHDDQPYEADTRDQPGQPGGYVCRQCDGFEPEQTQAEYEADYAGV
tara:strand:- start:411 stop:644 length:234 start_codon:yes stop_codon:yes gene_type:complete